MTASSFVRLARVSTLGATIPLASWTFVHHVALRIADETHIRQVDKRHARVELLRLVPDLIAIDVTARS